MYHPNQVDSQPDVMNNNAMDPPNQFNSQPGDITNDSQPANEKDTFLSLLWYDNESEKDAAIEKDDEVSSIEDWSEKDDDSDGVESKERDVLYPSYDPTVNWRLTKPILGMKFESPKQLKESLMDYGVSNGYQLEFIINDYRRLLVVCGKDETIEEEDSEGNKKKVRKCPFRLWASKLDDSFQIKTLNEKHTCTRKYSLGSLVTYSWIAKRYFKQIIENPEISIREMQADIMRKFECKVSTGQCDRAKKKVLDDYEGGLMQHYAKLSDYKAEILKSNPGSTVKMDVNEMLDGDVYFSSYYVCFKGVKDGWINGCRRVLCLDGCFLKNSGQLLSAIGRDANNHIYPLAWAVVSVENKENWKWFLNLVRDDIEMDEGLGLTLMSDQHKGIIEAVKDVFPHAEHRQCTRHIYANFKKKFRGLQFKNLFWKAANATTEQYFEKKMEELKAINKEAYAHLMERNPVTWSRAFFEVDRACDAFENGMSESFNSRIRSSRRKPIITMLEDIRIFVMQRIFLMATKAEKLELDVCPRIRKKLEDIRKNQRYWKVAPSDNIVFEVMSEKYACVVNINEQTCSCRSWQLSGIPCVHAVAALTFVNKDPETFVSNWLKKDMLREAYKYPIKPLRGSTLWPKTDDIKPLPPKERRMPGRPTVKRKRSADEKEKKSRKLELEEKCRVKIVKKRGIIKEVAQTRKRTRHRRKRSQKVDLKNWVQRRKLNMIFIFLVF